MKAQDHDQQFQQQGVNSQEESSSSQQQVDRQPNKTGIPDRLKAVIEHFSGLSLAEVRVHYNSDMPAKVKAHAYTEGLNIYIAKGQEKHLAHEIWHVVQQMRNQLKATETEGGKKIDKDPKKEADADKVGNLAEKTTAVPTENITDLQQVTPQQEGIQRVALTPDQQADAFQRLGGFFTAANSEVIEPWDTDWAESNCHGYTINGASGHALDPSELMAGLGADDSVAIFVGGGRIHHSGRYANGTLTHLLIGIGILQTDIGEGELANYDARYNLPADRAALQMEVIQPQIAAEERFALEGILDFANGHGVATPLEMTIGQYDNSSDEEKSNYINNNREALNELIATLNQNHGGHYDALALA